MMNWLRKTWYWITDHLSATLFASIIILGMAFADFFAMNDLFTIFGTSNSTKFVLFGVPMETLSTTLICAILCCILLEGLPTFLGKAMVDMMDSSQYLVNDKRGAKVGFYLSLVGIILTFAVVTSLRLMLIYQNGGLAAWKLGQYSNYGGANTNTGNSTLLKDVFFCVSPILTSLLALTASYLSFRTDKLAHLQKQVDRLHARMLRAQEKYEASANKADSIRNTIWCGLTVPGTRMPRDYRTFRRECFNKTATKLFSSCAADIPAELNRYNAKIESALDQYIRELGEYASGITKVDIGTLSISELIEAYNKSVPEQNQWNTEESRLYLDEHAKMLLSHSVVIAEYSTN